MARVSKGKLKHLWSLYGVWDIVRTRRWTILFFEPGKELTGCLAGTIIRKFTAEELGFFDEWTTGILGYPVSEVLMQQEVNHTFTPKKGELFTLAKSLSSKLEDLDGGEWLSRQLKDLKERNPDYYRRHFVNDFKPSQEPFEPFVRRVATKGYYDGCRKLDSELDFDTIISISCLENPTHLTLVRGKHKSNISSKDVYAYDIETNMFGGATHVHAATGKIHAEGSMDKLKEDGWLEVECGGFGTKNQNGRTYDTEGLHKAICTDHTVDAFLLANGIDQLKDGGIHE